MTRKAQHTQPTPPPAPDRRVDSKEEAAFLQKAFDIPPVEAARLVDAPPETAAQLAQTDERRADPLAGDPVPEAPASDVTADSDEEMLKPVLNRRNERTGAG